MLYVVMVMAGIEYGNNGEKNLKVIQIIGQFFESDDANFSNNLGLLIDDVARSNSDGKEYDSYTSKEFISFIYDDLKTTYDKDPKRFRIYENLKNEINKKFKEFKENIKKFKDIFKGEDDRYCYALHELFRSIQSSLDCNSSEKNLIFSEDFIKRVYAYRKDIIKNSYSATGGNIEEFKNNYYAINDVLDAFKLYLKDVKKKQVERENEKKNRVTRSTEMVNQHVQVNDIVSKIESAINVMKSTSISSTTISGFGTSPALTSGLSSIVNSDINTFNNYKKKIFGNSNTTVTTTGDTTPTTIATTTEDTTTEDTTPSIITTDAETINPEIVDIQPNRTGEFFSILSDTLEGKRLHEVRKELDQRGLSFISDEMIAGFIVYENCKDSDDFKRVTSNQEFINETLAYGKDVEQLLQDNLDRNYDFSDKKISEKDKSMIINSANKAIKETGELGNSLSDINNLKELKVNIKKIADNLQNLYNSLEDKNLGIDFLTYILNNYLENKSVDLNSKRGFALLYAQVIKPPIDIKNMTIEEIDKLIESFNGENNKYTEILKKFTDEREERDFGWKIDYAVRSLSERYERAQALAESKKLYSTDYINFSENDNDPQNPSGVQIASGIDNIEGKLNHYKIKSDLDEHEKSALIYSAFDITFNNIFNFNNITIQKLASSNIDLRSELFNYGIYDQKNNYFNGNARNKFISDKLGNIGLSPEEIESLGKVMEKLPSEIEKNYKILCGNFDANQDSFEKITKIYALGEVIDKIKTLFSGLNNKKLGDFMGIQLDENKPADVKGNYLFLKGRINGTETNIKYDLRTGKLYMNSLTMQSFNPPKIIVGNTEPNTEIGDLGSFEDIISGLDSKFPIQNDEGQENNIDNRSNSNFSGGNKPESEDSSKHNRKTFEELIKGKLDHNLKEIGTIVKEKAGEYSRVNDFMFKFLTTFNINLRNSNGEIESKEFTEESSIFKLFQIFINSNENNLAELSNNIGKLISLFGISRGERNETFDITEADKQNNNIDNYGKLSKESNIFSIDKKYASDTIKSLQEITKKFFGDGNNSGEKDKLRNLSHFDGDTKISIIDNIVDNCCIDGDLSAGINKYIEKINGEIAKSRNDKILANLKEKDVVVVAEADNFLNANLGLFG